MTTETHNTDALRAKWDAAFERLCEAERAMQEYINATDPFYTLEFRFRDQNGASLDNHQPDCLDRLQALRETNPAYFVPEFVNDHREKLCDQYVDLAGELMALPAPDLTALRWKLHHTDGDVYADHYVAQMKADIDQLMGPAPSLSGYANSPSKVPA